MEQTTKQPKAKTKRHWASKPIEFGLNGWMMGMLTVAALSMPHLKPAQPSQSKPAPTKPHKPALDKAGMEKLAHETSRTSVAAAPLQVTVDVGNVTPKKLIPFTHREETESTVSLNPDPYGPKGDVHPVLLDGAKAVGERCGTDIVITSIQRFKAIKDADGNTADRSYHMRTQEFEFEDGFVQEFPMAIDLKAKGKCQIDIRQAALEVWEKMKKGGVWCYKNMKHIVHLDLGPVRSAPACNTSTMLAGHTKKPESIVTKTMNRVKTWVRGLDEREVDTEKGFNRLGG